MGREVNPQPSSLNFIPRIWYEGSVLCILGGLLAWLEPKKMEAFRYPLPLPHTSIPALGELSGRPGSQKEQKEIMPTLPFLE